jgi:hypothetical protein
MTNPLVILSKGYQAASSKTSLVSKIIDVKFRKFPAREKDEISLDIC